MRSILSASSLTHRSLSTTARCLAEPSKDTAKLANKVEEARRKAPPEPRWSNRTTILLASFVGASMYMMGVHQGYDAGKKKALEEVALGIKASSGELEPGADSPIGEHQLGYDTKREDSVAPKERPAS